MRRLCGLIIVSSLLSACTVPITGVPESSGGHELPVSKPTPESPQPDINKEEHTAGLQNLLSRADRQVTEGDLTGSLATLERALRIAPQSSAIYLRMASIYQQLGQLDYSTSTAQRGLLYCQKTSDCEQLRALAGKD